MGSSASAETVEASVSMMSIEASAFKSIALSASIALSQSTASESSGCHSIRNSSKQRSATSEPSLSFITRSSSSSSPIDRSVAATPSRVRSSSFSRYVQLSATVTDGASVSPPTPGSCPLSMACSGSWSRAARER